MSKKYIFDNYGVEEVDGVECKLEKSVIHWESSDPEMQSGDAPEIPPEQIQWTEDRVLAELTMGGGISNICPIEIREERIYPDGKVEISQQYYLDPAAAYTLYLHFKKVDEDNPDGVFW